ncbi:hypothetical protein EVAR_84351_1 [Eumeta japonica]|uniref:DUF19 domain-containing protein n=1 Tax=Eumeta variegata TaxID=151549 RepID=A0A4C1U5U9_EUMVA|nr:hypothetical protein EVAR_84351_1 [Eumeta japonica]
MFDGYVTTPSLSICFPNVGTDGQLPNKLFFCSRELQAGIKCIHNFTDFCMEPGQRVVFKQIYSGVTGVVQDLCTKGDYQDEYLKHAECVKGVRMEYESCSRKYEVTLTSLGTYQPYFADDQSHETYLRTVCWLVDE